MPSSASSTRSRRVWLPTVCCLNPGVEEAEEQEAVWEEEGRTEALGSVAGVPSLAGWREESGLLLLLVEAASV